MKNKRPSMEPVSDLAAGRLSVYLRCLTYLESIQQKTVSSHELADRFHLNSAQIRKDLAHFGEFGTRGVGYNVARLKEQLVRTLGIDRTRNLLIVGAGNLGMALADYRGFNENGFRIVALVDVDRDKTGRLSRSGIPVLLYDDLVEAGVNAILNFAPVQIRAHDRVKLKSVDLRINLESLSFYLKGVEDGI